MMALSGRQSICVNQGHPVLQSLMACHIVRYRGVAQDLTK